MGRRALRKILSSWFEGESRLLKQEHDSITINFFFRTIGEFIRDKLELLRQSIMADVVSDLIYNSVKSDDSLGESHSIDSDSVHSIPEPAIPVPVKSFSFI